MGWWSSRGGGGGARLARQGQRERGALALDGPDPDLAAVRGGDVLDDREAQAGAAGRAVASGVDAVEALEDAVELVGRDADALVGDADVDDVVARRAPRRPRSSPRGSRRRRWRPGCRRPRRPARGCRAPRGRARRCAPARCSRALASVRFSSMARATILSTSTGHRLVQRVVALQAGELDDLLHQSREPVALGVHPCGEALHGLGVVGGVDHGVRQQLDGADRRLQLVADVGHEVTADRLDASLAGAVLDQREHQLGAERRHSRGDVARWHARRAARAARSRGSARRVVPAGRGRPARAR